MGPFVKANRSSDRTSHEITFNTDLAQPVKTRADFTYKIAPEVISIVDTRLGSRSVT
jgi:hypothetical protein